MTLKEDLEAMTNETPSSEEMGRYLCFVSDEFDRVELYLTFCQNLRVQPQDKSTDFWRGFCDYAEKNYRFRNPSEKDFAKIDGIWLQIEKFNNQSGNSSELKRHNSILSLHKKLNSIAYALQENK